MNARSLARGEREKASRRVRKAEKELKVARQRSAVAKRGKRTEAEETARKAQVKANQADRVLTRAKAQVEKVGG